MRAACSDLIADRRRRSPATSALSAGPGRSRSSSPRQRRTIASRAEVSTVQGTTVNRGSLMSARTRMIGGLTAVLVGAGMLAVPGGATAAPGGSGGPRFTAGAAGAGDPYFPFAGNGGYDVQHYDLDITYTPPAPAPAPLGGQLREWRRSSSWRRRTWTGSTSTCGAWTCSVTVNGKRAREVAPPLPGPRWRAQRTGRSRTTQTAVGAHHPATPEGQGRAGERRWSSNTAARPPGRRTSRVPSTAG